MVLWYQAPELAGTDAATEVDVLSALSGPALARVWVLGCLVCWLLADGCHPYINIQQLHGE